MVWDPAKNKKEQKKKTKQKNVAVWKKEQS